MGDHIFLTVQEANSLIKELSSKLAAEVVKNKKHKHKLMKAYEAGFNAGLDAANKDSRNEYAYMQYRRRKYFEPTKQSEG